MRRKRRTGARVKIGFANERFLETLASITGISPVGELGRDTPLDLSSLEAARGSLLIREVFSKYDDGSPSKEKETNTWKRFHEAETSCKEANKRIARDFARDPFWVLVRARMRELLGPFSWDECARYMNFGPGATTRLTRACAAAAYKYSGIPESTLGNVNLAQAAIRSVPLWNQSVLSEAMVPDNLVKVVPGNHVIAVPKNYKTDRTIAKEPDMNIFVQKGIGGVIRRRLKRVGIDLNDQTKNQVAAKIGSLDGSLATVDLSMASDTLSFELVSFLLPNDWWYALEQCRSPIGVLPSGEHLVYQKFSSMGNGYTFELETAIFWSICQQVCCYYIEETDRRILVYGDDIVIPSDKAVILLQRLQEAGFTPNSKKSFWEGPYRESCGKHYFLGCDITPFYVRRPVKSLDRLFLAHNNLLRWSARGGLDLSAELTALRRLAPGQWREPRLPDGFGDGAFIGAIDELRLDSHPYGWECWQVRALAQSQTELADDLPYGQLVASLRQTSVLDQSLGSGRVTKMRTLGLLDIEGGLPVREGKYRETIITIPRHALA